jgi:hypothetical protein
MSAEYFQYTIADKWDFSGLIMILLGFLCLFLIGLLGVLLPIGAIALRAAGKWIASIDVEFARAYTTLLLAGFIWAPFLLISMLLISASRASVSGDPRLLSIIGLAFIVQALVISWRLSVSFVKALLLNLVTLSIMAGAVAVGYFSWLFGKAAFLS